MVGRQYCNIKLYFIESLRHRIAMSAMRWYACKFVLLSLTVKFDNGERTEAHDQKNSRAHNEIVIHCQHARYFESSRQTGKSVIGKPSAPSHLKCLGFFFQAAFSHCKYELQLLDTIFFPVHLFLKNAQSMNDPVHRREDLSLTT